jgi:hypothetical protein
MRIRSSARTASFWSGGRACRRPSRPHELVDVAGGFQHRTRHAYADVIRASGAVATPAVDLTVLEKLVLTAVVSRSPVWASATFSAETSAAT